MQFFKVSRDEKVAKKGQMLCDGCLMGHHEQALPKTQQTRELSVSAKEVPEFITSYTLTKLKAVTKQF